MNVCMKFVGFLIIFTSGQNIPNETETENSSFEDC